MTRSLAVTSSRVGKRVRETCNDEFCNPELDQVESTLRQYCEWLEHTLRVTVTQAEREFQRTTRNGRNAFDLEEELCSRLQTMIDTGETLDGFPNLDVLTQVVAAPPKPPNPRGRPSWLDENRGKPPKQPRSRG